MILFTNQKKQQKGGQVAESQGFQEPTQRGRTRCGIEQGVEITVPKKKACNEKGEAVKTRLGLESCR